MTVNPGRKAGSAETSMRCSITVFSEENDRRLDHVLERLLPGMGLRGRRRLCELGLATINGHAAPPSRKVRTGDIVSIPDDASAPIAGEVETHTAGRKDTPAPADGDEVCLVKRTPHLAALYKPAGMHTESLAGKPGVSVQTLLTGILAQKARLVNRLDFPTSGLVAAALDESGERQYRQAQEDGHTEKRYLAILEGSLFHDRLATQRLLLSNRSRVLVELAPHPDPRRHTAVHPLAVMDGADVIRRLRLQAPFWQGRIPPCVTLAGCVILKGARHQIRAHCAALGFPLLGDRRYGAGFGPADEENERFFLHHARLRLPAFDALVSAPWLSLLEEKAESAATRWMSR